MQIDYVSRNSYIEESLWLFRTVDPPTEVPVLLVGSCREPIVFLDKTFYDFKNIFACLWLFFLFNLSIYIRKFELFQNMFVLKGKEVITELCLWNQEVDECFSFEWVDCVPNETETYKLRICPSSGVLPPCSSFDSFFDIH